MPNSLVQRRLELFPSTTCVVADRGTTRLMIAGHDLCELAERYGTPLYLYDRQTLDEAVDKYRRALARFYPAPSSLAYAGKAFLCLAVGQWAAMRQLTVDCSSAAEVAIAHRAGVERARILVHGVNKSPSDLQAALDRAGAVVVDHMAELDSLIPVFQARPTDFPHLWLRWRPGAVLVTHASIQTGQPDSKFGMSSAEVVQAAVRCLEVGLPLSGLHFHLGSQLRDIHPFLVALDAALDLAAQIRDRTGWALPALSPGGGLMKMKCPNPRSKLSSGR